MILITSAAYVTPGLASEFGKLPPCMLPVQNRRLYEHQIKLFSLEEQIVLSLPKDYDLSSFDENRLRELGVDIILVPEGFSLGESIVYVLNVKSAYSEPIKILHGDTLFKSIPKDDDVCAVSKPEDNYDWASASTDMSTVYSGYFSFSNQSLLIRKITLNNYNFIKGVEAYNEICPLKCQVIPGWMDFGLVNTYYRSVSKLTTERVFNNLRVSKHSVCKSSKNKIKISAEANWFKSLPTDLKQYAPSLWDEGEKDDCAFYEIEYYYLSSLANLFVFGENKCFVWKEIINSCVEYLNSEIKHRPLNIEEISDSNNKLYSEKTISRLEDYSQFCKVDLNRSWMINNKYVPSIRTIVEETTAMIGKNDNRFVSLMHGDPCFSNILYDFKSKSIKLIDPRGMDANGRVTIYGDFRYDVAKLAHSVLGLYDFIIGGIFNYHENSPYDLCFDIPINKDIRDTQEYFKSLTFGEYSLNELNTYPIMINLFLSMLPLHKDNPTRQKALLANALRLYLEMFELNK